MTYLLYYDQTGKVSSIQKDNMSIPVAEDNTDYQAFLKWNAQQETPLDLTSTITPPGPSWDDIRTQRNSLMAACDWTQLPDAVLTFSERQLWQNYRQALRDIPQNYTNPDLVLFPVQP